MELRRTLAGVSHLDIIKPLEFKGHKDDQFINNKKVGIGLAEPKIEVGSAKPKIEVGSAKPRMNEAMSLGVIPISSKNSQRFEFEQ